MILYRKAAPLRMRRAASPEPPFWAATAIAPYGPRRAAPVAIDYLTLRATAIDKVEVTVCENVRDELDRGKPPAAPVLIDATENAEVVFRRGEDALAWCEEQQRPAIHVISTRGGLPQRQYQQSVVVIAAWPLEQGPLEELFAAATEKGLTWGVAVPVLFPVTTELAPLEALADAAKSAGAAFFAPIAIEVEPTAKQALAQAMGLEADDDRYAMLFHAALEPVHIATERHLAALAAERGMRDVIPIPGDDQHSNWNAAALLTLTASRMIAMELDLDLAGLIARSARILADLDKPITRVAASASLAIIGGLDEVSVAVLTEWLAGETQSFVEYVNEQWRVRRA